MNPNANRRALAARLYSAWVNLYPAAFRLKHGPEMVADFSSEWRRLGERALVSKARYGMTVFMDEVGSLRREWWTAMPKATHVLLALSVLLITFDVVEREWYSLFFGGVLGFSTWTGMIGGDAVVKSGRRLKGALFIVAAVGVPLAVSGYLTRTTGVLADASIASVAKLVRTTVTFAALAGWAANGAATGSLDCAGGKPTSRAARLATLGVLGMWSLLGFVLFVIWTYSGDGHSVGIAEGFVATSLGTTFAKLALAPEGSKPAGSEGTESLGKP